MTDRILMRPMTITLQLSEPECGVYVAQAVSDDGVHALVESAESPYEAACDALATVTPIIRPDGRIMSSWRTTEQQAAMQCDKNDVWGERRKTDPVLRGVINVLCEHTAVSYYTVDWRPFLFGATCPAEKTGLALGLVQDPRRRPT